MKDQKAKNEKIRQTRITIAFSICAKFPHIYQKLYSNKGYVMAEKESVAAHILKALVELDPVIQKMLSFYYHTTLK
jgi:hypothetical protein